MNRKQKKILIRIISAGLLSAVCLLFGDYPFLMLIPYLVVGAVTLKKAIKGIIRLQPFDESFLMSVATVGAIALGEFTEAVAVMLFYQVGELFESIAVGKSRKNIASLMDIRPDYANVEVDGKLTKASPESVKVGTVITVMPGERVPIDGVVTEGETTVDMSALTGESLPADKALVDEVLSGSINLSGVIRLKTSREFGSSAVSRILQLVEAASAKKSRSESFISKFARVYTPAVCISALALGIGVPAVRLVAGLDANAGDWFYRALTFLVISCPCALVISIPLSFFAAIGGSGSCGILIKGSEFIETLSKASVAVFDKTGTVTKGELEVSHINPCGIEKEEFIRLAGMAGGMSNHPVSRSIAAYGGFPDTKGISEASEISGQGVSAVIDGKRVLLGNRKLMESEGISPSGEGVFLAVDGKFAGSIVVSDSVKPESESAIKSLKKLGVRLTVMLTGDSDKTGKAVAESVGIDRVYTQLLPDDKVKALEQIIAENKSGSVIYTGDGINDAPSLSLADVGIAMGALGSDAAIEAADVVIMDDNPSKIPQAVRISKKCMRIVHQNIRLSIGVKLLCLILGALGVAGMWAAIFADVGIMVLAVLNAVRCLKI